MGSKSPEKVLKDYYIRHGARIASMNVDINDALRLMQRAGETPQHCQYVAQGYYKDTHVAVVIKKPATNARQAYAGG